MKPTESEVRPAQLASRGAVHGLMSTTTAALVQGFGQLLVLAILARYVSKTDFGLVTATLVVIGLGRQLAEALVLPALVQRNTLTPRDSGTAATLSWLFSFVAVALLWLGAGAIAQLFNEPAIIPIVKVMATVFLLQSPLFVAEGLIQRDFGFGRLASAEVLSFLLGYTLVGVTLALLGAGVWALVWAYVAQVMVKTVVLVWQRPDALRLAFDPASARATLNLAGGFGTSKLLNYAALQGDYAVVAATMSAAAVGVYGRAYQLVSLPVMLLGVALDRVLFPAYARLQNDRPRAAEHYRHSVALSAMLIAPITVLFVLLAPELVRFLLGPNWSETVVPLQILAASLLFRMGYKLNDPLTKGLGVVYRRAWRVAVYALAVVLCALAGSSWGLVGVAIGVSVAITINFLLVAQLALQLLNISWRDYAAMHARGVMLALCLLPFAWAAVSGLRNVGAGSFAILCGVVMLVGAGLLLAALLRPDVVLGPDVQWLSRLVGTSLAPVDKTTFAESRRPGLVVEFGVDLVAEPALQHDLLNALHRQLTAQHIPVRCQAPADTARLRQLRAAGKTLLRAPRIALHDALIIFSSVRQHNSNGSKRVISWLALTQRLSLALSSATVTILQRGVMQELQALDRQGDVQSIVKYMPQALHQAAPDILVCAQQPGEPARRMQKTLVGLCEQRACPQQADSCLLVISLEQIGKATDVTDRARTIAAAIAAQWQAKQGDGTIASTRE